jgi:hypothetical protein
MARPLALVCLLAMHLPAFAQKNAGLEAVIDKVKRATGIIGDKRGHGTGFLLRDNLLVTNAHVIGLSNIDDLTLKFVNDDGTTEKFAVKLLALDRSRDLAMLKVVGTPKSRAPLELASSFDKRNKPTVHIVGNPAQAETDLDGRSRLGELSLVNSHGQATVGPEFVTRGGEQYFALSVEQSVQRIVAGPGNSGGPVVDREGKVIGVLTLASTRADIAKDRARNAEVPRGKLVAKMETWAGAIPFAYVKAMADTLADTSKWDDISAKAMERHAIAQTARSFAADIAVTEMFFKVRFDHWNSVRNSSFYFFNPVTGKTLDDDASIIKTYKECDAAIRKVTLASVKTAMQSNQLTGKERKWMEAQSTLLTTNRDVLAKKPESVTQKMYDTQMKGLAESREQFEKLAATFGVEVRDVNDLVLRTLIDAGVDFKSR